MVFGKTKMELKVGFFVFIAMIILTIFVLSIGGFKTWVGGRYVNFSFSFVNGVKVGAPVRLAGVDVGEVKRINFVPPQGQGRERVELVCFMKRDVRIPVDSSIWINTLGLLGEKYIEVMPGEDYAHLLEANGSLEGVDPIPMHEVFRMAKGIVEKVDAGILRLENKEGTIGKLLYDDTIYNELEALIRDIRKNPWKLFYRTKEKK